MSYRHTGSIRDEHTISSLSVESAAGALDPTNCRASLKPIRRTAVVARSIWVPGLGLVPRTQRLFTSYSCTRVVFTAVGGSEQLAEQPLGQRSLAHCGTGQTQPQS